MPPLDTFYRRFHQSEQPYIIKVHPFLLDIKQKTDSSHNISQKQNKQTNKKTTMMTEDVLSYKMLSAVAEKKQTTL